MANFRKLPSETEVLDLLREGGLSLPPLAFDLREARPANGRGRQIDAIVGVHWDDREYRFAVEIRHRATPQSLRETIHRLLDADLPAGCHPMVIAPYLSPEQLHDLERRGVSGVDLSGNGVVVVPNELLVFRSGAPNRYPYSAPIKNVYRGNSSLVGRVFLLRPEYPTVSALHAEIWRRGAGIALSTVSKVLKRLEEDLIVGRESRAIRLLQPEKLLDELAANFRAPEIRRFFQGRAPCDRETLMRDLSQRADRYDLPLVLSGFGSAAFYSGMMPADILSVYCTEQHKLLTGIPAEETDRFPNLEVVETDEETVYFDRRFIGGYPAASPVETYLEMLRGDKREQEMAGQVRRGILSDLERSMEWTRATS